MVVSVHKWVFWWFWVGVFCGVIALVNIFFLNLTHLEDRMVLFLGIIHWSLGGLACWAWGGVKMEQEKASDRTGRSASDTRQTDENVLAELMAHYNRRVSPRHSSLRQEILTSYLLKHSSGNRRL